MEVKMRDIGQTKRFEEVMKVENTKQTMEIKKILKRIHNIDSRQSCNRKGSYIS
jgi:hypothetical protein